jgi:hypothetical protein
MGNVQDSQHVVNYLRHQCNALATRVRPRADPKPVPADRFYLLAVVVNVAIVVLISGALAPAR